MRFEAGFAVINDSYNSNPVALAAMIELLLHTPAPRRRILAAGEMLELGPPPRNCIARPGARCAAAGKLDWIIGVQGDAREICSRRDRSRPSRKSGTKFFATSAEAAEFLADLVQPATSCWSKVRAA